MSEDLKSHDAHLAEEPEVINPQVAAALGREVRFGLTLIGLLLALLATALYVKIGSPGFPWKRHSVADASDAGEANQEASTAVPSAGDRPTQAVAEPVRVAAREAATEGRSLWGDDRYASRRDLASPPDDAPLPVGAAGNDASEPSAHDQPENNSDSAGAAAESADIRSESAAATSEQNWPAAEAPPLVANSAAEDTHDRGIEKVAATDPFQTMPAVELPAEPTSAGGPLIPEAEVDLEPQPEPDPDAVQPAAANEPTRAPPLNSPYGRGSVRDRYAAGARSVPSEMSEAEGPRAAPSAEHTPLHAVPERQWNSPNADTAAAPHESALERELQEARTPRYNGAPHAQPGGAVNDLDAPAAEFAAPRDDIAGHHHAPGHTPTPDGTYTVEPNDSFWTISQKVYGTGGYFKAVQRHNRKPGSQADGLEIGEKILVPPPELLEQKYPQLCPKRRGPAGSGGRMVPASSQGNVRGGRIYVVEEGDTLFDIARFELGKASRWAEIYALNRHQLGTDYNYIAPGTKLVLPDEAMSEPEPITTRPGAPYAR
jgi:nucleoid-associated protein YgaU